MSGSLGSLPSQKIRECIQSGIITGVENPSLQPASLDLSLTTTVYRMKGTFLPKSGETIDEFLQEGMLYETDLRYPLELNGIYLIKLKERLNLPEGIYAYTNNKSTTGRINLQTRLTVSGIPQFDHVPEKYSGDLWLEVIPKSFPVKLHEGAKLNQIRFFGSDTRLNQHELKELYRKEHLLYDRSGNEMPENEMYFSAGGLTLTIDLQGDIIGYRCFPSSNKCLDFSAEGKLDPEEFFEPIYRPKNGHLILRRDEFYILCTKEYLRVPPQYAAEMVAYDPSKGEYRSHYAGFFDCGWGYGSDGMTKGKPAVLEVFTNDNDFILRDGQPICKFVYDRMSEVPDIIYGTGQAGSHYSKQEGPRLSRHFRTV